MDLPSTSNVEGDSNTPSIPLCPPSWLDEQMVTHALREGGRLAGGLVSEMRILPANAPGDNYVSVMWRVNVTLLGDDSRECALVIKCLPSGKRFRRIVVESHTFESEGEMFAVVVPGVEGVLAAAGKTCSPFTARLLLRSVEPEPFLVFEDLVAQGFRMADRRVGLDPAHARVALRVLARFHAASSELLRRKPTLLAAVPNFFERPVRQVFASLVRSSLRATAERVSSWKEPWASIVSAALASRADGLFNEFSRATCTHAPDEFACVLHGDFWLSNMLFRYDDDGAAPVDLRFVDLQLSHAGSPAADLLYFLYSSLDDEAASKVDELLEEYAHMLHAEMESLGRGPAPSLGELKAAMESRGPVALVAACAVRPVTRAKTNRVYDVEASMAGGDAAADDSSHLYADPDYEASLRILLPEFGKRGWLLLPN